MGWQSFIATVFQAGNRIVMNSAGLFVYNGAPALGNLVASIAPTSGTDAAHNNFLSGDAVYGGGGSYVNIATNNGFRGFPALTLNAPNMVHVTDLIQVASDNVNPGAANEQSKMALSSGKENHLDDGAILLYSESADATVLAAVVIEFGGDFLVTVNRGGFFMGDGTTNFPFKFIPANVTHMSVNPIVTTASVNAGASSEQNELFLSSGKSGLDDAAIELFSEAADGSSAATTIIEHGGTNLIVLNKTNMAINVPITNQQVSTLPTLITTDGWHAITKDAGWSNLAGQPVFSVQLTADGMVHMTGAMQFNANIANNTINNGSPLAAASGNFPGYRPATQIFLAGAPGSAGVSIGTNGVVTAAQAPGQTTVFCNINGRYPINL